jgi:hypothetical protein
MHRTPAVAAAYAVTVEPCSRHTACHPRRSPERFQWCHCLSAHPARAAGTEKDYKSAVRLRDQLTEFGPLRRGSVLTPTALLRCAMRALADRELGPLG